MRPLLVALAVVLPTAAAAQGLNFNGLGADRELKGFDPAAPKPAAEAPSAAGPPAERVKSFDGQVDQAPPPQKALVTGPTPDREVKGFSGSTAPAAKAPPKAAPDEVQRKSRVGTFDDAATPKPGRFPWKLALLGVIGTALAVPMLRLYFRRFSHQMELEGAKGPVPADIAAQRRPADVPQRVVPAAEKAMGIVRRAGGWVSVGRVAVQCGLDASEAADLLATLEGEGRLESSRDGEGRTLYRYPQRAS